MVCSVPSALYAHRLLNPGGKHRSGPSRPRLPAHQRPLQRSASRLSRSSHVNSASEEPASEEVTRRSHALSWSGMRQGPSCTGAPMPDGSVSAVQLQLSGWVAGRPVQFMQQGGCMVDTPGMHAREPPGLQCTVVPMGHQDPPTTGCGACSKPSWAQLTPILSARLTLAGLRDGEQGSAGGAPGSMDCDQRDDDSS